MTTLSTAISPPRPILAETARTIGAMPNRDPNPSLTAQVGARLAARRKERGLTQIELAQKLGVTQAVLSKYERGEVRLTAQTLIRLSENLSISIDELLGRKGKTQVQAVVPGKRLLRRLSKFEALPKRKQEALLQTIDAVLGAAS